MPEAGLRTGRSFFGDDVVLVVELQLSEIAKRHLRTPHYALRPIAGFQRLVDGVCQACVSGWPEVTRGMRWGIVIHIHFSLIHDLIFPVRQKYQIERAVVKGQCQRNAYALSLLQQVLPSKPTEMMMVGENIHREHDEGPHLRFLQQRPPPLACVRPDVAHRLPLHPENPGEHHACEGRQSRLLCVNKSLMGKTCIRLLWKGLLESLDFLTV
jgi:hypothetical protein